MPSWVAVDRRADRAAQALLEVQLADRAVHVEADGVGVAPTSTLPMWSSPLKPFWNGMAPRDAVTC